MKKSRYFLLAFLIVSILLPAHAAPAASAEDGLYSIGVLSDSKMFRVTDCALEVQGGQMTAVLVLSGKGYGYLYPGTASQATSADRSEWIPYQENAHGAYSYRVPIAALDMPVPVAAYSTKYSKWYDRQLTFQSGSLRKMEREVEKAAVPVPGDGSYMLDVSSDSKLFQIKHCLLKVKDGKMEALLTVEGAKYGFLFAGKAKDALHAPESQHIPLIQNGTGAAMCLVPVKELGAELPFATWSDKKNLWYDRTLLFDAASLQAVTATDATSFAFTGGSGRTVIQLEGIDESLTPPMATITFSSASYTRVKIGEKIYLNENKGGNAVFTLPLIINGITSISAETVAMSKPRWVDYELYLYTDGRDAQTVSQKKEKSEAPEADAAAVRPEIAGLTYLGDLPLQYAGKIAIRLYEDGYRLLQTTNGRNYLTVPEGRPVPEGMDDGITVLRQPLDQVYLVATSAMCLADALEALPSVRFAGTKAENWHIKNARAALEGGSMLYAGKYSAPDYELLLSHGCDLAIESTMVLQAPDVLEKMEELGIPVFIDLSGLESHPLGRTEWIKAYGVLFSREPAAETVFAEQISALSGLVPGENGPTAAYFYLNSNGAVVSKSAADYMAGLISIAGGRYLGPEGAPGHGASVTVSMESFYALAREADYLFYNGAIDDPPASLEELISRNELFRDFNAVREGRVYSVSAALYQSSVQFGEAARELHSLLGGADTDLPAGGFFRRLP